MDFLLDAPVAFGTGTTAAAYDAVGGADVGSTAAAGTILYKRLTGPCAAKLRFLAFQTASAIAGAGSVVLTAAVRPTVGVGTVASGTRVVGTITVPVGTLLGSAVFGVLSGDNININPGEEFIVELTTKGTSTGTGAVCAGFTFNLVGPTSGGTATVPLVTPKPFGALKTGSIVLTSSGQTGQ